MDFNFHHCCLEIPLLKSEIHKIEKVDYDLFSKTKSKKAFNRPENILYFHWFSLL